jgi:hypothetical protein
MSWSSGPYIDPKRIVMLGAVAGGTVFKITPTGTLTTPHSFDRADGALPTTLVQHSNGTFYGTTVRGGANVYHACGGWCGMIFSLSVGLGPFVETESASGNVGRPSTF